MIRLRLYFVFAFLLSAAACDDSPKGPGSFTVSVEWNAGSPPVGAAVVFLSGVGLGEITPQGGAQLWHHAADGEMGGVRVVIVDPGMPSTLRFTVPVADLRNGTPAAALLSLAGHDNELIPVSSAYRARVY